MRIQELEAALDRHGGDLGRWPAHLRADAEALAARDPDAATRLATAARLETTLAAAMQPLPVDSALMGRILSATSGHAGHAVALRPTPRLAAWAFAAMVMFLSTGYLAGLALPATQGEDVFAGLMFGSSSISLDADIDADAGSLL